MKNSSALAATFTHAGEVVPGGGGRDTGGGAPTPPNASRHLFTTECLQGMRQQAQILKKKKYSL